MTTSEFEYYLLSELISMPDRVLAQKIELLIWAKSPIPNEPILEKFVDLLKQSEDGSDFWKAAETYVNSFNIDWRVNTSPETYNGWAIFNVGR